jgi:predicted HTH transcriptional regulator
MILNLIKKGENLNIEFKESFSKPIRSTNKGEMEIPRKEMNKLSLKPIVGFLNAEGGTLLIGVDDKGNITGIENDHFENEDKYLLNFNSVIKERIGSDCFSFIDYGLFRVKGKLILKVDCKPSSKPQFIDKKEFYVRTSPATREYIGPDLLDYVKERFKN